MARRNKSSGGVWSIIGLAILAATWGVDPLVVWVILGIFIGIVIIVFVSEFRTFFTRPQKKPQPDSPPKNSPAFRAFLTHPKKNPHSVTNTQITNLAKPPSRQWPSPPPTNPAIRPTAEVVATKITGTPPRCIEVEPTCIPVAKQSPPPTSFLIPPAPQGFGAAKWIPAGESITIAGTVISGGMIYVGTFLSASSGNTDPCLINPSLPVAAYGDYTTGGMGYWPSYSEISNSARRAYLDWLSGGRSDPETDDGYVFLFFYGLERRVLIDAPTGSAAKADFPVIAAELRRLLGIYGERSHFLRHYASGLLEWLELTDPADDLYLKPIPQLPQTNELPLYLKFALGQAAIAAAPVPAALALAWVKHDPAIPLRTPAIRCSKPFEDLFQQKYSKTFGAGLKLRLNRTKLKFIYSPASSGFSGNDINLSFGDVPDVTAVTGPTKKLQLIVEETTRDLESYSRFIGRKPELADSLEAYLLLPFTLWPDSAKLAIESLKALMGSGMFLLQYETLLGKLGAQTTLTRDKIQALARALESVDVGFEPDVLAGAEMPKPRNKVALFALPSGEVHSRTTPAYQTALLTLQLASAVATADGAFSAKEINYLRVQVESWTQLTPSHQRRLMAHLRLLIDEPMSLTALKKKIEPLSQDQKETIASFMATVAQSDGIVSPTEIKLLERLYKMLGVEPKKVFSDLHAVAASFATTTAKTEKSKQDGFSLDPTRIAELQRETQRVSALLTTIFTETEDVPVVASVEQDETEPAADELKTYNSILGMDEAHSAFARLLLSRPQWSKDELEDAAADLDLMLNGALEQLNEAAYDAYDIPFTDGDDLVDINTEIVEKLET
ncbi:MAG: TerB N-terminal domain-containing protein [Pseudomonadota bacterium]